MKILRLPHLVAVVIPSLGRTKTVKLSRDRRNEAIKMVLKEFEKMFGGATPMRVPPGGITRMLNGEVLLDPGQTLVVSGTTRRPFLKRKNDIRRVAKKVGVMLDQEAVAALAFPSDSFIVLLEPS